MTQALSKKIEALAQTLQDIRSEVARVFIGQDELVTGTLAALFSRGHVLIEGVPGLGKTLLVRTLGKILGAHFARIQFTPDLMPSDITGSHIYNQKEQKFVFVRGPIFTNLLLADEINRSPAKTHSALLEIMQETQVTIDNRRYVIEPPFFVLATQNPVESEGTYALPEAQLDRFLLKLLINYPGEADEEKILRMHASAEQFDLIENVKALLTSKKILEVTDVATQIQISDPIIKYINRLVRQTRGHRDIYLGCSPRAGIALLRTARVLALMEGREFVIPDDVKLLVAPAFRHRIVLTPEAEVEGRTPDEVIRDVVGSVEVPRSDGQAI
ncbi:MAG: MoxR family ATPase [Spirochaetales bacterium]|nr:MoxR family ATPase [Leptospiraceae bacterium]MCP5480258.1 MoxR family ATPase [Spirochaetales bacterium]MCP5486843.1 MoxR family ATPase [Spirochaetales bacterium]